MTTAATHPCCLYLGLMPKVFFRKSRILKLAAIVPVDALTGVPVVCKLPYLYSVIGVVKCSVSVREQRVGL
jgi:hypothetical protein